MHGEEEETKDEEKEKGNMRKGKEKEEKKWEGKRREEKRKKEREKNGKKEKKENETKKKSKKCNKKKTKQEKEEITINHKPIIQNILRKNKQTNKSRLNQTDIRETKTMIIKPGIQITITNQLHKRFNIFLYKR